MKLLIVLFSIVCLLADTGRAATQTWTGGGGDANWITGANWSGTAPVNNDDLIFSGATRTNNTNDISNLTAGWVQFANGGFTLNGNQLTLNPSTTGIFTNLAGTNVIANDLIISTASKYWSVAANSELRLTGVITNTSATGTSAGWVGMTNDGTLRIMGNARSTRGMDLFRGTIIVDGGLVDASNDGFRFKPQSGFTATVQLTNNGTIRIGGGGNFRMGNSGTGFGAAGAANGISRVDLNSGTLEMYGANSVIYVGDNVASARGVFNQNGGLVWGSAGSGNTLTIGNVANGDGTYNLNRGTLWIAQVRQGNASATNVVFNFNGGTLKPSLSSTTFMQGLLTANVQSGGAIIDTTNLNITIAQPLAGSGGLTKLGSGTLELSGTNSYAGNTVISNGALNVSGRFNGLGAVNVVSGGFGGTGVITGPVTVQSGATLSPGAANVVGVLTLQGGLTLAGSVSVEINKSLAVSNDLVQVTGLLTNAGNGPLFISNLGTNYTGGDSYKIFSQPLLNGSQLTLSPAAPGPGLIWTNKLAVDGSIGVIALPGGGTSADLVGLTLSVGTLSPAFTSNVFSYAVSLAYSNSTVTLTPTSANPAATIRIISAGLTNATPSGVASSPIALRVSTNQIIVAVTAPDNVITKEYFITINRIPPNVVLVLADDGGFSDWGSYGGEIPTPNLDRLATNGLRFRQFYNTARCSTTRCSLLTGLYTHQVAVDPSQALPNLRTDNNVTIAELLQSSGYRTYLSGKWHIGTATGRNPWQRGFQHYWGFPNGHSADTWTTNEYRLVSTNNEVAERIYAPGTFYQSDAIGDYSVDFLDHHFGKGDQKPFFLHMTFGAGHFPLQAPKALVDLHTPTYTNGWDVVRAARYQNMLAQGVIDARYPLSLRGGMAPHQSEPIEEIPAWNTLAADRQADLIRRMAIYAAMLEKLDDNVGRVVALLEQQGQLENTIIIALSDNGGNHEGGRFGQTGGTINAAPLTGTSLANMGLPGQPNIYLGGGWANVNNTPFRLFKHSTHGGGVRSPLIIHWPQGLTRTNQWDDQPGHLIDIMATIADVTGASYPTQYNSHVVLPLEGMSLKPHFTSNTNVARSIGFEHESNRGLIEGNWKFVTKNFALYDGSSPAHELELYNLTNDPVELTNLAYAQPQLVATLASNWNAWAARVGVPAARWLTSFTNTPPPVIVTPAPNASDLFLDTFARSNQNDIDVSAVGMSGSRVPPLGGNNAHYEGFEGSGSPSNLQISNGALVKAAGGMIESGIMHNFVGADIAAAGGFSVELNVQSINSDGSDAANRYVGFGVGLSQAEAVTGWDINTALAGGAVAFRGSTTGNTGVADFFVELDFNGNVKVWSNGALLDTVSVGQNFGTLTATFAGTGFSTANTVTVKVFFNGQPVDINTANANSISRTFQWDQNDSNYIGLSSRATSLTQMDNLAIRKLPVTPGLVIGYAMQHGLTGAVTAPDADPDGDGVVNFGEWAFGGDPTAADPSIAKLKGVLVTPAHDFQFEFQRLSNAANYGLQYRYFISENFIAWTPTTPVIVSVAPNEDNPGYELVALQLPAATIANTSKLFLRVLAEPMN